MTEEKRAKVYIIGVGPGSAEWLTAAAEAAIDKSDIILAWEWSLNPVKPLVTDKKVFFQDTKNYLQVEKDAAEAVKQSGQTVAVLRVGDPCVSSSLSQLLRVFGGCDIEIIPSVGSVQFAAAAAKICIDESIVISFHDHRHNLRDEKLSFLYDSYQRHKNLIVLTDETQMPPQTAAYLIGRGLSKNTPVVIGEHLSLEDEMIFRITLGEVADSSFRYDSILVVKQPA